MDVLDPILLARIPFAFTVSFHIILLAVTVILVALLGLRRSHRKSVETHLNEAAIPQARGLTRAPATAR